MSAGQSKMPSWAKHLDFTAIDLVAFAVAFVLAYYLKFGDLGLVAETRWRGLLVMLLLVNLVITLLTGPYSGIFRRGYWEDVGANFRLALWSFLAAVVAFYLFKVGAGYSREMLVTTYVVYLALSCVCKAVHKKLLLSRRRGEKPEDSVRRVVLATTVQDAAEYEALAKANDLDFIEVVGFCLTDAWDEQSLMGRPVVSPAGLVGLCASLHAHDVLVAVEPAEVGHQILETAIEDGIRVRFAIGESLGVDAENRTAGRIGAFKTIDLERYDFGTAQLLYLPIKRVADIVFGVLGCVLLLPVAGIVKLSYMASGDRHSIVYSQERIGLDGKPFMLHKLRTMVWNADEVLAQLLESPENRAEWERDQKLSNDPRITDMGRFLRNTSLDELPQFVNVLKGEMSVVGPRPLVPGELEAHGGRQLYNKVKPGLTGWWACNGRSNIEYRERLELEYHYVRHCSLYLDVLCVFRTFAAVLKREGAK